MMIVRAVSAFDVLLSQERGRVAADTKKNGARWLFISRRAFRGYELCLRNRLVTTAPSEIEANARESGRQ
jgi:hypothetical protein